MFLVIAGVFLGVFLAAGLALVRLEERGEVKRSLRAMTLADVPRERDRELLQPLPIRALRPVVAWLSKSGRRVTPHGYVDNIRRKLVLAGHTSSDTVDRFLAVRLLGAVLVPVWALVFFLIMPQRPMLTPLGFLVLSGFSFFGPDLVLRTKISERQKEIRRRLPDILDLLTISVEAGMSFDQAMDRTIARVPGPLSDEFGRMLGEVQAGAHRADALRALDERTGVAEVKSFVFSLLQADSFGIPIGRMLRAQAEEMRIRRRQLIQERAQKAPVKMLFPMVLCVFPAIFVVVIGPGMISVTKSLAGH
jgi:tight adherence protein C